ncbi:MAG: hypothetical protein ACLRWM_12345 [Streptococcus sp.]
MGKYVPDLIDYSSENNIIDFEDDNIDKQLQQLMKISDFEMDILKNMLIISKVKGIEVKILYYL